MNRVIYRLILSALFLGMPSASAQQLTEDQLRAKMLANPPQPIVARAAEVGKNGIPAEVEVAFIRADLDGSGQFQFLTALFTVKGEIDGFLRVFKQQGTELILAGDQEDSQLLSGYLSRLELVDLDGERTVLDVPSVDQTGATTFHQLFLWTGSSLRRITPENDDLEGAYYQDLDGDGTVEIVVPPLPDLVGGEVPQGQAAGGYGIYRFNGELFQLAQGTAEDPTGRFTQDGDYRVVQANRVKIHPRGVTLRQIQRGRLGGDRNEFRVRIGNLTSSLPSNPGPRSVEDVDLDSLVLGRNLRPTRAIIATREGDDDDDEEPRFIGPYIRTDFDEQAVLAFLPRAQLTKPLEVGDRLTLEVRGKMKDGAPLFGAVEVRILRDDD